MINLVAGQCYRNFIAVEMGYPINKKLCNFMIDSSRKTTKDIIQMLPYILHWTTSVNDFELDSANYNPFLSFSYYDDNDYYSSNLL